MTATLSSQGVYTIDGKAANHQPPAASTARSVVRWCSQNWRAVLAEVISTSLLLLLGCMACVPFEDGTFPPPLYAPFGFGFAVLFNIQSFGHISGAHMNPAVTLAAVIWGSMSIPLAVFYMIAQCGGAILGYGLLTALTPIPIENYDICSTLPRAGMTDAQAFGVEVMLTAALTFLNCAVWDPVNGHLKDGVPLKFGFVIAGLSVAGSEFTGASMNPARTLGPAVWNRSWRSHWVYWVGPMVSAAIVTLLYKYILTSRKRQKEDSAISS